MEKHEPDPRPNRYDKAAAGKSWRKLHKNKARSFIYEFYSKEKKSG